MDLLPHAEIPDSPHSSDHSGGGGGGVALAVASSSPGPVGTGSSPPPGATVASPSRYESQKRRDWNTFGQYLRNHRPPLSLARCSGAHVLEFLRYLDQFGKTKVHGAACPFFGHPAPPAPCPCPLRQAWGSLDALVGRLRAAYEENGGRPENNPFGARAVRLYLREVRDHQSRARGVSYEKKKRKKPAAAVVVTSSSASASAEGNGHSHHHHHHVHHQHHQMPPPPPPPPGAAA